MLGSYVETATIAGSASATSAIPLGNRTPVALTLPTGSSALTASTATVTFPVSLDGSTFCLLRDIDASSAIVQVGVTASNANGAVALNPDLFRGWTHFKIETRNASAASAVVQAATRTFKVAMDHAY